jgi:hypothetical protein
MRPLERILQISLLRLSNSQTRPKVLILSAMVLAAAISGPIQ